MLGLLSPETFVLKIFESIPRDEIVETQCKRLRRPGFRVVLDDAITLEDVPASISELTESTKIDVPRVDRRGLPHLMDAFLHFQRDVGGLGGEDSPLWLRGATSAGCIIARAHGVMRLNHALLMRVRIGFISRAGADLQHEDRAAH